VNYSSASRIQNAYPATCIAQMTENETAGYSP
jgi:hypothetical protein